MSTMKLNGIELKQISKGNKIYTSINFNHTSYSCLMCFLLFSFLDPKGKMVHSPQNEQLPPARRLGLP